MSTPVLTSDLPTCRTCGETCSTRRDGTPRVPFQHKWGPRSHVFRSCRSVITWTRIREQYLYGERATVGNRVAEVIRCYAGEWSVFQYVNGKQRVIGDPDCLPAPNRYSYSEAKRVAAEWVRK